MAYDTNKHGWMEIEKYTLSRQPPIPFCLPRVPYHGEKMGNKSQLDRSRLDDVNRVVSFN